MKAKEYLVKKGHLKEAGRGRLSAEHRAIIMAAVAEGIHIEGYSVNTAPATENKPVVKVVKADPNAVYDVPDETRPERDWAASVNNKTVGMRTVCNMCTNSLTHCHCQFPKVWIDHEREGIVTFSPRKEPLKNKRW